MVRILIVVLAALFFVGCTSKEATSPKDKSDTKPAVAKISPLPGSTISAEEAAKNADLVMVATVDTVKIGDPTALGVLDYTIQVTVNSILGGLEWHKQLTFGLRAHSFPEGEAAPVVKTAYIFFLKRGPDFFKTEPMGPYTFIKMLPATDQNIADVAALALWLPGHAMTTEDAAFWADLVMVATIEKMAVDTDAPGQSDYDVHVSVNRILKGVEDRKQLSFGFRRNALPGRENGPEDKTAYIFFLKAGPEKSYHFIKMLAATDKNISEVAAALDKVKSGENQPTTVR